LSALLWLALFRWYSLFEHYATPGFAFDKIPGYFNSWTLRGTALIFAALALIYACGYRLISHAPTVSANLKLAIVGTILLGGLVNVCLYPAAAIDLFVYLAEIKLAFFYHQNPYLETLAPWFLQDPFTQVASYKESPLVYPPAWLLVSALPVVLAGFDSLLRAALAFKLFSLVLVGLCALLIGLAHEDSKRRWLAIYTFAANPLVLYEAVGNAHNDVLLAVFLLAAVLALRRRSVLAGPLLGLSVLVKFLTAPLAPVFLWAMLRDRWPPSKILWSTLLAVMVAVAVVAPYWAGGAMIDGIMRALRISQGLDTASVFSLTRVYLRYLYASALAVTLTQLIFLGFFAVAAAWVIWYARHVERALLLVLLLFYLFVSSLHPWYLIPVIGLLALDHDRRDLGYLFAASALGLLVFPFDVWARFNSGWPWPAVKTFLALFITAPMLTFVAAEMWRLRTGAATSSEHSTARINKHPPRATVGAEAGRRDPDWKR
jgi:hypothetical protein